MANWDDEQRFWAETVRTGIFAVVGGVAAVVILQPFSDRAARGLKTSETTLEFRARIVDDFLASSHKLFLSIQDECTSKERESARTAFDPALKEYTLAARRIAIFFNNERLLELNRKNETMLKEAASNCVSGGDWKAPLSRFNLGNSDMAYTALLQLGLVEPLSRGGRIVP